MTRDDPIESAVRNCYSTWSETYHDEYYGPDAAVVPVHREIVLAVLAEVGATTVLDAGCGPASFLRHLPSTIEPWGFDLTPEMVATGRRVLAERGIDGERIWEGSVTDPDAYAPPYPSAPRAFDAAVCVGVMPHVTAEDEAGVLRALTTAVRPGGAVVVQARNALFSLFTLNRYTKQLFEERLLAGVEPSNDEEAAALEVGLEELWGMMRTDLPPVRAGKAGEPGYDEVLSRSHVPFELAAAARDAGLVDPEVLFYNFHALPPIVGDRVPALQRAASAAMTDPRDWRGHFMASAFMVVARRP